MVVKERLRLIKEDTQGHARVQMCRWDELSLFNDSHRACLGKWCSRRMEGELLTAQTSFTVETSSRPQHCLPWAVFFPPLYERAHGRNMYLIQRKHLSFLSRSFNLARPCYNEHNLINIHDISHFLMSKPACWWNLCSFNWQA